MQVWTGTWVLAWGQVGNTQGRGPGTAGKEDVHADIIIVEKHPSRGISVALVKVPSPSLDRIPVRAVGGGALPAGLWPLGKAL